MFDAQGGPKFASLDPPPGRDLHATFRITDYRRAGVAVAPPTTGAATSTPVNLRMRHCGDGHLAEQATPSSALMAGSTIIEAKGPVRRRVLQVELLPMRPPAGVAQATELGVDGKARRSPLISSSPGGRRRCWKHQRPEPGVPDRIGLALVWFGSGFHEWG